MSRIALALIKRLVATGLLDADDIWEMGKELSERDRALIQAAWIEGLAGDDNKDIAPTLRVIDGGQASNTDAKQD